MALEKWKGHSFEMDDLMLESSTLVTYRYLQVTRVEPVFRGRDSFAVHVILYALRSVAPNLGQGVPEAGIVLG